MLKIGDKVKLKNKDINTSFYNPRIENVIRKYDVVGKIVVITEEGHYKINFYEGSESLFKEYWETNIEDIFYGEIRFNELIEVTEHYIIKSDEVKPANNKVKKL